MSRLTLAVFSMLLFIAGCSGGQPTTATPPVVDRYGALVPSRSLDATAQANEPCGVLTEDQLRGLELEPAGRLDPLPGGPPACVWEGPGFTQEVSVALLPNRDFLVDTYRSRAMYQYFEPITVAGLPATAQQTTRGALTCTVTTGIALGQGLDVSATEYGAQPDPPCDTAKRVSELVVANLPEQPAK